MDKNNSFRCVKIALVVGNGALIAFGLFGFVIGLLSPPFIHIQEDYSLGAPRKDYGPELTLVSCVAVIIGCAGLFGALREHFSLLLLYALALIGSLVFRIVWWATGALHQSSGRFLLELTASLTLLTVLGTLFLAILAILEALTLLGLLPMTREKLKLLREKFRKKPKPPKPLKIMTKKSSSTHHQQHLSIYDIYDASKLYSSHRSRSRSSGRSPADHIYGSLYGTTQRRKSPVRNGTYGGVNQAPSYNNNNNNNNNNHYSTQRNASRAHKYQVDSNGSTNSTESADSNNNKNFPVKNSKVSGAQMPASARERASSPPTRVIDSIEQARAPKNLKSDHYFRFQSPSPSADESTKNERAFVKLLQPQQQQQQQHHHQRSKSLERPSRKSRDPSGTATTGHTVYTITGTLPRQSKIGTSGSSNRTPMTVTSNKTASNPSIFSATSGQRSTTPSQQQQQYQSAYLSSSSVQQRSKTPDELSVRLTARTPTPTMRKEPVAAPRTPTVPSSSSNMVTASTTSTTTNTTSSIASKLSRAELQNRRANFFTSPPTAYNYAEALEKQQQQQQQQQQQPSITPTSYPKSVASQNNQNSSSLFSPMSSPVQSHKPATPSTNNQSGGSIASSYKSPLYSSYSHLSSSPAPKSSSTAPAASSSWSRPSSTSYLKPISQQIVTPGGSSTYQYRSLFDSSIIYTTQTPTPTTTSRPVNSRVGGSEPAKASTLQSNRPVAAGQSREKSYEDIIKSYRYPFESQSYSSVNKQPSQQQQQQQQQPSYIVTSPPDSRVTSPVPGARSRSRDNSITKHQFTTTTTTPLFDSNAFPQETTFVTMTTTEHHSTTEKNRESLYYRTEVIRDFP